MKWLLSMLVGAAILLTGCFTHQPERSANSYLGDIVIRKRVQQVLSHQSSLDGVIVTTTNAEVYLHGTVRSLEEKQQAGQLAAQVHGVERIFNEIKVALPPR